MSPDGGYPRDARRPVHLHDLLVQQGRPVRRGLMQRSGESYLARQPGACAVTTQVRSTRCPTTTTTRAGRATTPPWAPSWSSRGAPSTCTQTQVPGLSSSHSIYSLYLQTSPGRAGYWRAPPRCMTTSSGTTAPWPAPAASGAAACRSPSPASPRTTSM